MTGTTITVDGGNAGNTVNASALTGPNRVVLIGGAARIVFTGGAGNDIFEFSAANLTAADKVSGGAGSDQLAMTSAGTVAAGGVSGVEIYSLADGGANSLILANANFAGVSGSGDHGLWRQRRQHRQCLGADRIEPGDPVGGFGSDSLKGGAGAIP